MSKCNCAPGDQQRSHVHDFSEETCQERLPHVLGMPPKMPVEAYICLVVILLLMALAGFAGYLLGQYLSAAP